jgi:hypothetical protein
MTEAKPESETLSDFQIIKRKKMSNNMNQFSETSNFAETPYRSTVKSSVIV